MAAPFVLSKTVLAELYAHCESGYPEEACGILMGPEKGPASALRACGNIQNKMHGSDPKNYPRDAKIAYLIDPQDLFRLTREARDLGWVFKAIFHSHVDVGAYFSDEDQRQAAPLMTLSRTTFAKGEGLSNSQVQGLIDAGSVDESDGQINARMPSYPELVYLVADIRAGKGREVKGFFWHDGQRSYTEIPVQIGMEGDTA